MNITRKSLSALIKESISRYIIQENPVLFTIAGELAYLSLGLVFAEIYTLRENDLSDDKKIQALIDLAQQYDNTKDIKVKKISELIHFAQECDDVGLIHELMKYLLDCKKLESVLHDEYGLEDFLVDTVSHLGETHWENLSYLAGQPEHAWMAKPVGALFSATFDIVQYDAKIKDIKRTIDVDRLVDMEMNINDLHRKMINGKLPCKPDPYGLNL